MQYKFGIVAECLKGKEGIETLSALKSTGFDSFFTLKFKAEDVFALKNKAVELGLDFEFIHAPFAGINTMWQCGLSYLDVFNGMKQSIESAAACGIQTVVIHVSSGWHPPEINDLGFARYDSLVELAIQKNVKLAFENLRKTGNLAYMLDRYENIPEVGFCYDAGHAHCYTETVDWLNIARERTICTHIHDNYGRDKTNPEADGDIHILPFDGNADYSQMVKKLSAYGYQGSLMLEVDNSAYLDTMTEEGFLITAYERLQRIASFG